MKDHYLFNFVLIQLFSDEDQDSAELTAAVKTIGKATDKTAHREVLEKVSEVDQSDSDFTPASDKVVDSEREFEATNENESLRLIVDKEGDEEATQNYGSGERMISKGRSKILPSYVSNLSLPNLTFN